MFETILVCVDESEHALKAAKFGLDVATKYGASVVALHVNQASLPLLETATHMPSLVGDVYREELKQAHDKVKRAVASVFEGSDVKYRFRGEVGQPISVIVTVAEQESANLIVLGSRGTGGFKSFLMGSVSIGVLHHAPCPVLVVR